MKANVCLWEFRDTIMTRRPGSFSYAGLEELYKYLTDLEESTGEEILFDPIGICCEFAEYETVGECLRDYALENLQELEQYTDVILVRTGNKLAPTGIIIQNF